MKNSITLIGRLRLICTVLLFAFLASGLSPCVAAEVTDAECRTDSTVQRIKSRGVLLVGTTGDYCPLTFQEQDGRYWGFCIEVAEEIAKRLDVDIQYVATSWPTLTADVMAEPQKFDLALGGITITPQRLQTMLMSEGYLANGKTILCRASDSERFRSVEDINRPDVKVMVNPGGTNQMFAKEHLQLANVVIHNRNEEIPELVARGDADVMITEVTEVPYYVSTDKRLAAPLADTPFTRSQIGVLLRKGQDDLLEVVNAVIMQMKADGSLQRLHDKYLGVGN